MRAFNSALLLRVCAVAVGTLLISAEVRAVGAEFIQDGGTPTIERTWAISDGSNPTVNAVASGAIYSNVTNFQGAAFSNGGFATGTPAAGTYSTLVLDDLNPITGGLIGTFRWSLSNLNTTSQPISSGVRFYADNGANAPGAFIAGFNFNPITVAASSITTVGFNATGANQFTIPNKIWAGVTILANGTATSAVLNNEGQGLFSPPDVGTSLDELATVSSAGSPYTANNPTSTVTVAPFGANPPANFGWELVPAPEPASGVMLGIGAIALMARRRR